MCEHKRIRCVDNVFTCKDCGTVLPAPGRDDEIHVQTDNAQEGPQRPAKRKAKKEGK